MIRRIHPVQMEAWIKKLQKRMTKFLQNPNVTKEEKIEFIRQQYSLLDVTIKVLDGHIYFLGCSQPPHHDGN
jgi:hypothetical protein